MANRASPAHRLLKWLTPGIGVKRWMGVLFLGITALALAFALVLLAFFRANPIPPLEFILTLGGTSLWVRAGLAAAFGVALVILAVIRINRAILQPLDVGSDALIDAIMEHRQRGRGPKVVAIGGGTGLPVLLRGLKAHTSNLTAIVTVADDGGSSGRLRRDLGVPPPGDFRNNIAALARDEALMTQLFQYRFGEGGLEGHSFGNLFITALTAVTGSFEQALIESSRVLAVRGQVLPSTLSNVTLMADLREAAGSGTRRVTGESVIPTASGMIMHAFLEPENAPAYPEAVQAILSAEVIVLGPGSLFTSILPNLLVKGIAEAVRHSKALKVYVCNVATQHGETDNFSVADHVRAIEQHAGKHLFDVVLVNDEFPPLDEDANFRYVRLEHNNGIAGMGLRVKTAPLVDIRRPWRHESKRLAQAVVELFEETRTASS